MSLSVAYCLQDWYPIYVCSGGPPQGTENLRGVRSVLYALEQHILWLTLERDRESIQTGDTLFSLADNHLLPFKWPLLSDCSGSCFPWRDVVMVLQSRASQLYSLSRCLPLHFAHSENVDHRLQFLPIAVPQSNEVFQPSPLLLWHMWAPPPTVCQRLWGGMGTDHFAQCDMI